MVVDCPQVCDETWLGTQALKDRCQEVRELGAVAETQPGVPIVGGAVPELSAGVVFLAGSFLALSRRNRQKEPA